MRATYNITDDKLKYWPDERLSNERYQEARRAGFTFWHGSKCFAAKWNPTAEDFIKEEGCEIEQDDTPDDIEGRVQRFEKYAEDAQAGAERSQEYLEASANTERRKKNAVNSIEKNIEAAEHWQRRIQGAIERAAYREKPEVIARRIRGLESDVRHHENKIAVYDPQPSCGQGPNEIWVGKGRGGYWSTPEKLAACKPWHERWIAHLKRRIEYEMALLEAAGGAFDVLRPVRKKAVVPKGKAKDRKGNTIEVGGAIGRHAWFNGSIHWRAVVGVNRSTVDVVGSGNVTDGDGQTKKKYHVARISAYECAVSLTAEQVKTDRNDLFEDYTKVSEILERRKQRKKEAVAA